MCEATFSQYSDYNSIYESLSPELEEGLQEIEEDSKFVEGLTRLKSVEVSLKIFKNQQQILVNKTLYQHEWSQITFALTCIFSPLGPLLYFVNHKHHSKYSRESTHALVKKALNELMISQTPTDTELISCSVRLNLENYSHSSIGGCWVNFRDSSKEILHLFTATTPSS